MALQRHGSADRRASAFRRPFERPLVLELDQDVPIQGQEHLAEPGAGAIFLDQREDAEGSVLREHPRKLFLARRVLRLFERSEEHTSELQSLMRISYAVFCLTKKITPT